MGFATMHSILPEIFASSFAWFGQHMFCLHKNYAIKKGIAKCDKCGTTWEPSILQFLDKAKEVSRDFANCKHLRFQRTEEYRAICLDCGMHGAYECAHHGKYSVLNFTTGLAECKECTEEFHLPFIPIETQPWCAHEFQLFVCAKCGLNSSDFKCVDCGLNGHKTCDIVQR